MTTPRFRFPKASRLYLRKEINELVNTGKTIHVSPLKVFYKVLSSSDISLQMAVAVPKRNFKLATSRNRIKRQIREVYRLNCVGASTYFKENGLKLQLMVVYNSKEPPEYKGLESKIILILQRLQDMHERNSC